MEVMFMKYKICPSCGTKNPEDEILCKKCMADLTSVEIVYDAQQEAQEDDKTVVSAKVLVLMGENFSIVVKSGDVVGRQGIGREYLKSFQTVSRQHAKFYTEGNKWFIEDIGSTNGTFLNNNPLQPGQKREIKEGDIIKLSSQVSLRVKL